MDQAEREELKQLIREAVAEAFVAHRRRERGAEPRVDPWEGRVAQWLATRTEPVTTTIVAEDVLGLPGSPRAALMRIGTILRRHGWLPRIRTICDDTGRVLRRERSYSKG